MFKTKKIYFAIFFFFALGISVIYAQTKNIQYPIAELGNCSSKNECELFCEKEENMKACVAFAETKGLMEEDKLKAAKIVANLDNLNGPGGCQSETECEAYCGVLSNLKECLSWAQKNDFMAPEEIKEVEGIVKALDAGVTTPGGCTNKNECKAYCDGSSHINECMEFALAAGFMSPEEAEIVKKTGGKGPGGCQGKNECDTYCQVPENNQTCMEFGLEQGLIPPEEVENVKKTLEVLKSGVKLPACQSEAECNTYCAQDEHKKECMDFALAMGYITPEEAEKMQQNKELGSDSGPGGCKSEAECTAYCQDPANKEICVEYSLKRGEITQEQYDNIKRGDTGPAIPGECPPGEDCTNGPVIKGECPPGADCTNGPVIGPGECPPGEDCSNNMPVTPIEPNQNMGPTSGAGECPPGEDCSQNQPNNAPEIPSGENNLPPPINPGECPSGGDCSNIPPESLPSNI